MLCIERRADSKQRKWRHPSSERTVRESDRTPVDRFPPDLSRFRFRRRKFRCSPGERCSLPVSSFPVGRWNFRRWRWRERSWRAVGPRRKSWTRMCRPVWWPPACWFYPRDDRRTARSSPIEPSGRCRGWRTLPRHRRRWWPRPESRPAGPEVRGSSARRNGWRYRWLPPDFRTDRVWRQRPKWRGILEKKLYDIQEGLRREIIHLLFSYLISLRDARKERK